VQQYANEYQSFFLQNQTSYRNIALNANSKGNQRTWRLATIMARAIESCRGEIPFGALMARCRRESGFDPGATEKARYAEGKYGIGPWGITGAWDATPPAKPYGLTKAQAYDPIASTTAVVKQMKPVHQFIFTVAPTAKQDLVLYSWMIFCNHASGPGELSNAVACVQGRSDNGEAGRSGLAGNVCRCWNKFHQVMLQGLIATSWMGAYGRRADGTKYTIYTSQEGAWRLMIGALDACVWERRRDAVLAGKVLVSETLPMIAQAIQKAVNTGQGAILEAFRARASSWDRSSNEANVSRFDVFGREAQNGVDSRDQNAARNAETVRTAASAEQLHSMPSPTGPIMVINKDGAWET
jgi:hypothetical protein